MSAAVNNRISVLCPPGTLIFILSIKSLTQKRVAIYQ